MPTKKEHQEKAEHNEFFVSKLDNPFFDWQITGVFYAALHHIESYLATQNIHPANHVLRDNHIHRDKKLSPIYLDYRELKQESRDARYTPYAPTQADVTRVKVHLEKIKKLVAALV